MDRLHRECVAQARHDRVRVVSGGEHAPSQHRLGDRWRQRADLLIRDPHVPHLLPIESRMLERGQRVHGCGSESAELGKHDRSEVARVDQRFPVGELAAPHCEAAPPLREQAVEPWQDRGDRDPRPPVRIERQVLGIPRIVGEHRIVDPEHASRSVRLDQHEIAILVAAELGRLGVDPVAFASDQRRIGRADRGTHESRADAHS